MRVAVLVGWWERGGEGAGGGGEGEMGETGGVEVGVVEVEGGTETVEKVGWTCSEDRDGTYSKTQPSSSPFLSSLLLLPPFPLPTPLSFTTATLIFHCHVARSGSVVLRRQIKGFAGWRVNSRRGQSGYWEGTWYESRAGRNMLIFSIC